MVRQNEVRAEVEGPGGSEGIVLPLELVQNGIDDVYVNPSWHPTRLTLIISNQRIHNTSSRGR